MNKRIKNKKQKIDQNMASKSGMASVSDYKHMSVFKTMKGGTAKSTPIKDSLDLSKETYGKGLIIGGKFSK